MNFHISKVIRDEKQDEIVAVVDSHMKPLGNDLYELCSECREVSVFLDIERGYIVCRNCGFVKGELSELSKEKLRNDVMDTHTWGSF